MKLKLCISIKISNLGKLIFFIFCLYTSWFKEAFGNRLIILYGSVVLLTAIVAFEIVLKHSFCARRIPKFIKACLALALFSALTGYFVAVDVGNCYSAIVTFVAFTVVCYDAYYLSVDSGSYNWILKILVLCGLVCALHTLIAPYRYRTSGVYAITLSEYNNPNDLGLVVLMSVFSLLYDQQWVKKHFMLSVSLVALFSVVIIRTASRKIVLCLGVFLILWLYATLKDYFSESSKAFTVSRRNFGQMFLLLAAVAVGIVFLTTKMSTTAVFEKLSATASTGSGLTSRIVLYLDAWKMFKEHPLLGVGFYQYILHSPYKLYSHSSYAEILSCTGIIGTLLFFVPLFKLYYESFREAFRYKLKNYKLTLAFAMFSAELLLGLGTIFIYEFYHMLVLMLLTVNLGESLSNKE